jgi:uncharacterized Zn-binding protein involved in type VI secretion
MGKGNKGRFESGRRKIDAPIQHALEEAGIPFRAAVTGCFVIEYIGIREEHSEQGACTVDACRKLRGLKSFPMAAQGLPCACLKRRIILSLHRISSVPAGRHGQDSGEGARLVDGSIGGQMLHDRSVCREGADGSRLR